MTRTGTKKRPGEPGQRVQRDRIASYHEAGHAVVATVLERAFLAVVLDDQGGAFQFSRADGGIGCPEDNASAAQRELLVVLGGMAAECIRFGHYNRASCANDKNQARSLAQWADATAVESVWEWALGRAKDIVAERWLATKTIAEELRRLRRMDSQRVRDIVGRAPICHVVYQTSVDYADHRADHAQRPSQPAR